MPQALPPAAFAFDHPDDRVLEEARDRLVVVLVDADGLLGDSDLLRHLFLGHLLGGQAPEPAPQYTQLRSGQRREAYTAGTWVGGGSARSCFRAYWHRQPRKGGKIAASWTISGLHESGLELHPQTIDAVMVQASIDRLARHALESGHAGEVPVVVVAEVEKPLTLTLIFVGLLTNL